MGDFGCGSQVFGKEVGVFGMVGRPWETRFRESFDSFRELSIFRTALTYNKLTPFSKMQFRKNNSKSSRKRVSQHLLRACTINFDSVSEIFGVVNFYLRNVR